MPSSPRSSVPQEPTPQDPSQQAPSRQGTALPVVDATTERGVHNPRVIDLIAWDAASERVVLSMVEFRPWTNSVGQLEELEDKFNNYIDYVLDGHLYGQYPTYVGKRVRIELCSQLPPVGDAASMLEAVGKFLASVEIDFVVREGFVPEIAPAGRFGPTAQPE